MFEKIIGQSPNIQSLLRSAQVVAATDVTVLIKGETGTGKELLANAVQQHSPRHDKPFIMVNCAALPESIAESELFGHRKGAFTGAIANQTGKLPAADGGTLFLDEIDSLPLPLQAKLLRFLESGECQAVGETRSQRVNVRVIAASNADLEKKIARGDFRKDLYYRLNVVPIEIPALRERKHDIEILLNHYLKSYAHEHNLPACSFSKTTLQLLRGYRWPGNVRELRNLCQRLAILLPGRTLEIENLPDEIRYNRDLESEDFLFTLPELGINLERVEVDLIRQALMRTHGNRTHSARLLGISRDTLLYRMQKHGLS